MKKSISWESLAWIVVWIVILWFTLLWIINILDFNKDLSSKYTNNIWKYVLDWNANNISKKIDISGVLDDENYYIYKNDTTKTFEVFTWASNENYKYINSYWEKIDQNTYSKQKFTREFIKRRDILRHTIRPDKIPDQVFWFDAMNINWTNNSWMTDGDLIAQWNDLSWNWNNAFQSTSTYQPQYVVQWNMAWVQFDWTDDRFLFNHNALLNNDNDCYAQFAYSEKSFAIVLKTWLDVTRDQVVFEQWWQATWYNFMIHNWDLYAWIHNKADDTYSCTDFSWSDSSFHFPRESWHQYKSVNLWEILADRVYFIMVVQDSSHIWETWNDAIDDANNTLKIYLNWKLASSAEHIDPQPEHHLAWMWSVNERNVRPRDTTESTNTIKSWDWQWWCDTQCLFFEWLIWEFVSWNYALSKNEVSGIQNYFTQKWLWWIWNIEYNTIEIDIDEYNQ